MGEDVHLAYSGAPGLAEMTALGVTKATALQRWCADHDWLSIKVMWADARNDYADVVARVRRRAAAFGG